MISAIHSHLNRGASIGLACLPRSLAAAAWSVLLVTLMVGCASSRPVASAPVQSVRPQSVRVGGIVLKWVIGEKALNYERVEPLIRRAAAGGAQIVVTTECFLDGYAIRDKKIPADRWRTLCESLPDGEYVTRLRRLAAELKIHLIAGLVECDGDKSFNTAILIGPDGTLHGRYRKHDLEHELWRNTPGTETPVFETRFGKLGLIICADRRNAPLVQQIAGRSDFVICPSGGMWGPERNDFYLQDRSRENQVPIVFVHPTEFLVTARDGTILERYFIGDTLSLKRDEVGGPKDLNDVRIFDVPLAH